jgi:hypothetical protein
MSTRITLGECELVAKYPHGQIECYAPESKTPRHPGRFVCVGLEILQGNRMRVLFSAVDEGLMLRTERVYSFIWGYWHEHGYSPTHIEIMRICPISGDQLRRALTLLQQNAVIKLNPGKDRGHQHRPAAARRG